MKAILSKQMRIGDRIVVEPAEGEPFEATVEWCIGWSLVHGVMDWRMRDADGNQFTYGIHIDTAVEMVS